MPEQILQTILAALDSYEGDIQEVALAKKWVEALQEDPVELDPEELAELKEAIAESEAEEARGFSISHEQIKQRVEERIANYK